MNSLLVGLLLHFPFQYDMLIKMNLIFAARPRRLFVAPTGSSSFFLSQKFATSEDFNCSWSLSAISAINSLFVGFLTKQNVGAIIDRPVSAFAFQRWRAVSDRPFSPFFAISFSIAKESRQHKQNVRPGRRAGVFLTQTAVCGIIIIRKSWGICVKKHICFCIVRKK